MTSKFTRRFWERFTPANWIQIGLLVFALVGGYFRVEARIIRTEGAVSSLAKVVADLNIDGTKYGQLDAIKNAQVNTISLQNQTRIVQLETGLDSLKPKVERIDANVQWIMEWVKLNNNKLEK